ncbi:hypothetical protein [Cellulomonas soli]
MRDGLEVGAPERGTQHVCGRALVLARAPGEGFADVATGAERELVGERPSLGGEDPLAGDQDGLARQVLDELLAQAGRDGLVHRCSEASLKVVGCHVLYDTTPSGL